MHPMHSHRKSKFSLDIIWIVKDCFNAEFVGEVMASEVFRGAVEGVAFATLQALVVVQ